MSRLFTDSTLWTPAEGSGGSRLFSDSSLWGDQGQKWYEKPAAPYTDEQATANYERAAPYLAEEEQGSVIGTLAAAPGQAIANIKDRLTSVLGTGISEGAELLGADQTAQDFAGASRRVVEDIGLREQRLAEQDAGPISGTIRQGFSALGEAAGVAATGAGLPGLAAYYGTSQFSEAKAEGKSDSEALAHAAIESAWTVAGGKLLGAGTGELAEATANRAAGYVSKKLGSILAGAVASAGGEAAEEIGTELSHYLTEVAFGKKYDGAELTKRLNAVIGPSLVAGGAAKGIVAAIEARQKLLPKVAEAIQDAERFAKDNPEKAVELTKPRTVYDPFPGGMARATYTFPGGNKVRVSEDGAIYWEKQPGTKDERDIDEMLSKKYKPQPFVIESPVISRRVFADATGKGTTNAEYRETFVDALKANQKFAEAVEEPPTTEAESPALSRNRPPLSDKDTRWMGKQLRSMEKRGTMPYEFGQLSDTDPETAFDILIEADNRASAENMHRFEVQQEYKTLIGPYESGRARLAERRGGDADSLAASNFDQYVQALRDGEYPALAAEASTRGGGDLESGLFEIVQGGAKQFNPVKAEDYLNDLMEEYRVVSQDQEVAQAEAPAPQQPTREAGQEEVRLPFEPQGAFSNPFPVFQINLGEAGKKLARGKESAKRWLKQNFTSAGLRNDDIQRLNDRRLGSIAKHAKALEQLQSDLDKAIYGQYGRVKTISPQLRAQMDAALKGQQVDLPAPILAAIAPMRAQIDALSKDFLEAGIGGEEFQGSVDENMGVYVTRTYRKFSEKNWAQVVKDDPQVMNAAKTALKAEFPDDSESDIQWRINMLLDKDSVDAKGIPDKFHKDAKFQTILMQRKDLPEWLRNLYGENRDPWINHTLTVTKMAQLLAHNEFMQDVRSAGLQAGFCGIL